MKVKHYLSTLLILVAFCSCKEEVGPEDNITHELVGLWEDTLLRTNGSSVHIDMTFTTDSTFVQLISLYGSYEEQADSDISAWYKLEGKVVINGASLNFNVNKYTWWDYQYDSEPIEEPYYGILYTNCVYTISSDKKTLELNYILNSAISDESTSIELRRSE